MSYEIRVSLKAEKDLKKIPKPDTLKIINRISLLSVDPYPEGSKRIKASKENLYPTRKLSSTLCC